jgi:acyl transferase domain-containing protein
VNGVETGVGHADLLAGALTVIERLETRLREAESRQNTPVAVIGAGCRLPGGVTGPDEYWELLAAGRDGIVPMPADRRDQVPLGDYAQPGGIWAERGGFLAGYDPAAFDAPFFEVSPRDAAVMDPQHRLLLEVTWEALEHAGIPAGALAGTLTGVYVGLTVQDYLSEQLRGGPDGIDAYTITSAGNFAAGRIAHFLGLRGPTMMIDSACSSSLVAIHLACQALRAGEADLALAGGVNLILGPEVSVSLSRWGMLSPDGRCKSFDARADGFGRGEGCGVVVLKRLGDAERDGDRVLAVVRGTAVNHDGRSSGLTVPNGPAQREVIRAALRRSGLEPQDVDYVEAHGTGTALGDPIELEALADAYHQDRPADRPLVVGSAKANLGHLESAAGVVGFLKAVLALGHRQIPPQPGFGEVTPNISTAAAALVVPVGPRAWPGSGRPARAGISSFGASGTNAHVIVEQAPEPAAGAAEPLPVGPVLVPVSAATTAALRETAARLAAWLKSPRATHVPLSDVAYTLARRRAHLPARLTLLADDPASAAEQLAAWSAGEPADRVAAGNAAQSAPGPVFVFSGQGGQWAGMGRALLELDEFAALVDELEPVVAAELGLPLRSLLAQHKVLNRPEHLQPALYAIHLGLTRLWAAFGVRPAAVIGHSMGEFAAAVAAGAITAADGARVVCRRAKVLAGLAGGGAMAVVDLPEREAADLPAARATGIEPAILLGPNSTSLAGPEEAVVEFLTRCAIDGVYARRVRVDIAYHSSLVEPVLDELRSALADLPGARPLSSTAFYTSVLDDPRAVPGFDAAYWAANMRRPVRLVDAVRAAAQDGFRTFLELSPHPVLAPTLAATVAEHADAAAIATMRRDREVRETLLTGFGLLHCQGEAVDWAAPYPAGRLADLPHTVFRRQRHWLPRRLPTALRHPLDEAHVEQPDGTHLWQGTVSLDSRPWLADHVVEDAPVLPGTAYCEMVLAAAAAVAGDGTLQLAEVAFLRPLRLDSPVTVGVELAAPDAGGRRFTVRAKTPGGTWADHATGRVEPLSSAPEPADLDEWRAHHARPVEPAELYGRLRAVGQQHGLAFAALTEIRACADGAIGAIVLPDQATTGVRRTALHPVLLDACLQLVAAAWPESAPRATVLPSGIGVLRQYCTALTAGFGRIRLRPAKDGYLCDAWLVDEHGVAVAELTDVRFVRLGRGMRLNRLFEARREDSPAQPLGAVPRGWAVLSAGTAHSPVADELRAAGLHADPFAKGCPGVVALAGPVADRDVQAAAQVTLAVTDLVRQLTAAGGPNPPRLVVAAGAQRLGHAPLRGLIRVLAYEHPELRPRFVGLPAAADPVAAARLVLGELARDDDELDVEPADGHRRVARLAAGLTEPRPLGPYRAEAGETGYQLATATPGVLDGLGLRPRPRRAPAPGEVEIEVHASGLNFSDVLRALDAYPLRDGEQPSLGNESVGRVGVVGDGVQGLSPGQRVIAFTPGILGSYATVPADYVAVAPPEMDPVDAATIPVAFGTAWYALRHVARLEPGERVLIHAAAGGVGLAAVAVARQVGAEVLATAGTPAKRQLLADLGVATVMDSRSLEFGDQVMAATGGRGVDVVLNSLAGPALWRSLELLAPGGRFVEIGKKDVHSDASLRLRSLARSASFAAVDLDLLLRTKPRLGSRLLGEILAEFQAGRLHPLPARAVPVAEAEQAFRTMAAAEHTGKLVLTLPRAGDVNLTRPAGAETVVRVNAGYIVTGGLGGLGLTVARWLAERGAGLVVVNGRSMPSAATAAELAALPARVVTGDIADPAVAGALVAAVEDAGLPLRGVIHAAAVFDDAVTARVTPEQLHRVWRPKVDGALRLHDAVGERDLDWFCLFSSAAALIGSPGQAAYAAANAWLDAFAHWRRAQGLPATAVNWGPWSRAGRGQHFAAAGHPAITPQEGVSALEDLLAAGNATAGVIAFDPERWFASYPAAAKSPYFAALDAARQLDAGSASRFAEATGPRRRALVEQYLTDQVRAVLRLAAAEEVDLQVPLTALGLDSLLALELRNRLEAGLAIVVPATVLFSYPTITALAGELARRIGPDDPPEGAEQQSDTDAALLAEIVDAAEQLAGLGEMGS